jgi:hypothetical protein
VFEREYLDETLAQLHKLKAQAEKAIAQVDDAQFFELVDPEANSIAIIMKHVAGNMRSRWTGFLTTDGEKPDRNRDNEFEREPADTRQSILDGWEDGWRRTLDAISSLQPDDLGRTVTIRGEPHTVLRAIDRQMIHYAGHVGQIVLLAKHFAGMRWQTLSMPKSRARAHFSSG